MTTFTPPKGGEFFFRRMRRGVEHDAEADQGVDTFIDNLEGVMYYLEDILDDDKESNFKLASKSKFVYSCSVDAFKVLKAFFDLLISRQ